MAFRHTHVSQLQLLFLVSVMAAASVRSELNCPVCWEIYTKPITLPCGHNFCHKCIERTWDGEKKEFGNNPSCPQCRRRYGRRPELNNNVALRNIAEQFYPNDQSTLKLGSSALTVTPL